MKERVLFDAGTSATLHDRMTGHLQSGDRVAVTMWGGETGIRTGVIVGFWNAGDEERMPVVKLDCNAREIPFPLHRLSLIARAGADAEIREDSGASPASQPSAPVRIPDIKDRRKLQRYAERMRDAGDDVRATLAEDLAAEISQ